MPLINNSGLVFKYAKFKNAKCFYLLWKKHNNPKSVQNSQQPSAIPIKNSPNQQPSQSVAILISFLNQQPSRLVFSVFSRFFSFSLFLTTILSLFFFFTEFHMFQQPFLQSFFIFLQHLAVFRHLYIYKKILHLYIKKLIKTNWFIRRFKNVVRALYTFIMICISHKNSVLFKISWITIDIVFSHIFSRSVIEFYIYIYIQLAFFTTYSDEKFKIWKR